MAYALLIIYREVINIVGRLKKAEGDEGTKSRKQRHGNE